MRRGESEGNAPGRSLHYEIKYRGVRMKEGERERKTGGEEERAGGKGGSRDEERKREAKI